MNRYIRTALTTLAAIAAASFAFTAQAQVASGAVQMIGPMTRDLGALQTHTARTAGTTSSDDQSGFNVSRIVCVFNQSSYTGNPSTTFLIQNKDAASGQYYTLVTSAAITSATGLNAPVAISAGAGVPTTTNVSANIPIARNWRVRTVVAGTSTPTVWGTVGCSAQ